MPSLRPMVLLALFAAASAQAGEAPTTPPSAAVRYDITGPKGLQLTGAGSVRPGAPLHAEVKVGRDLWVVDVSVEGWVTTPGSDKPAVSLSAVVKTNDDVVSNATLIIGATEANHAGEYFAGPSDGKRGPHVMVEAIVDLPPAS